MIDIELCGSPHGEWNQHRYFLLVPDIRIPEFNHEFHDIAKPDADQEAMQETISCPYQEDYQEFHKVFSNIQKRPVFCYISPIPAAIFLRLLLYRGNQAKPAA